MTGINYWIRYLSIMRLVADGLLFLFYLASEAL